MAKLSVPRPPIGFSAAATWTSAWVSTPPVMTGFSTMVKAIPFKVEGGTHPPADRPVNPDLLSRSGRPDRLHRWVPGTILGPVDRSISKAARHGVNRLGSQTEPRTPDLTPSSCQPQGWGSEALLHSPCRVSGGCRTLNPTIAACRSTAPTTPGLSDEWGQRGELGLGRFGAAKPRLGEPGSLAPRTDGSGPPGGARRCVRVRTNGPARRPDQRSAPGPRRPGASTRAAISTWRWSTTGSGWAQVQPSRAGS